MWDVDQQHFVVRDQVLTLEIEDIYFMTWLTCFGNIVVLVGGRRGSADWVDDYVEHNYHPSMQKSNNKFSINQVVDLTLCTILFTIT
jgi:hypothetical protein